MRKGGEVNVQDPVDRAIEQIENARRQLPTTHFNHIIRELNYAVDTLRGLKRLHQTIVTAPQADPHKPLEPMAGMPGVKLVRKPPPEPAEKAAKRKPAQFDDDHLLD